MIRDQGVYVHAKTFEVMILQRVSRLSCVLAALQAVIAFQPLNQPTKGRRIGSYSPDLRSTLALHVATQSHVVDVVTGGEDDPRVLDVAAFRNGMINPEMMVERAKSKRDAIDTTSDALKGLKIGLLYVGPLIGGFTYLESNDVASALQNYAVLGGGVGAILAANNYMGRGVHVPDIPEATK